jgi:aminoglycoside/choline kinase family phosphotransferase
MTNAISDHSIRPDAADSLRQLAENRFGVSVEKISKLAGDASNRHYVRLHHSKSNPPTSVGMIHVEGFDEKELPFLNVQAHFQGIGLRVPEIYGDNPDVGVLLLEDAGGRMLMDVWETEGPEAALPFYKEAVRLLSILRENTNSTEKKGQQLALSYGFDEDLFNLEMHMTRRFAFEGLTGIPASEADFNPLFSALSSALCRLPFVLTHRDYHSRNLMAQGDFSGKDPGRLVVLDFQDARLGPFTYDLASLVFDSYVNLPEWIRDSLISQFWCVIQEDAKFGSLIPAQNSFDEALALIALQRNLKALGTFGFQKVEHNNSVYLPFIRPTIAHVRRHLSLLSDWTDFERALDPYLSALESCEEKEMAQ